MTEKTINVSGIEVTFRSSASIPRIYRKMFGRDIFKDISSLTESYSEQSDPNQSTMPIEDLEIFENVAYVMAYHANPEIPDSIDAWLDQFPMFSIYEILPEILQLWGDNVFTTEQSKKNKMLQVGK